MSPFVGTAPTSPSYAYLKGFHTLDKGTPLTRMMTCLNV